jgi:purine nucleoside phosphorylase
MVDQKRVLPVARQYCNVMIDENNRRSSKFQLRTCRAVRFRARRATRTSFRLQVPCSPSSAAAGLPACPRSPSAHREVVRTPYGEPSSALLFGQIAGRGRLFLARHGHGHTIPPHRVNYRANLWALKERARRAILAVASVGGIARAIGRATSCCRISCIDYTSGRETTFFDGGDRGRIHIDFTRAVFAAAARHCLAAASAAAITLRDGGVYAAVSGPRLETAAEIDRSSGTARRWSA